MTVVDIARCDPPATSCLSKGFACMFVRSIITHRPVRILSKPIHLLAHQAHRLQHGLHHRVWQFPSRPSSEMKLHVKVLDLVSECEMSCLAVAAFKAGYRRRYQEREIPYSNALPICPYASVI